MTPVNKVVIVGSGVSARSMLQILASNHNAYDITVIRKNDHQLVPCAIPYIFHRLSPDKITVGDNNWEGLGARVLNDKAVDIHRANRQLILESGREVPYDRLVIATGADPVQPPIPGIELGNVHYVDKDLQNLRSLYEKAQDARHVVMIGGGFIGVEFADELANMEVPPRVSLVESESRLIPKAFDPEFSQVIEETLVEKGVRVYTDTMVKALQGDTQVTGVSLSDGNEVEADMVICCIGVAPNSDFAKQSGLEVHDKDGGIITDEYYYTTDPNIMACGDCITKGDFFDGKGIAGVRLASTAAMEGKIAGFNIERKTVPNNQGVMNFFSTKIGDQAFGASGMTETEAIQKDYDVMALSGKFPNRHPVQFDDVTDNYVKLIFDRQDGRILGGEVRGDEAVGEMVNAIGMAVKQKMTAYTLMSNQYATHPLLTTGPSGYPLLKLSVEACMRLMGR